MKTPGGVEYYIKRDTSDLAGVDRYLVTKFLGGRDTSSAVYTLLNNKGALSCDCPAGTHRGRCKHMRMIDEFIARGEPVPHVVLE